ncbi:MAG: RNA-binding S4 domain-containing protein [Nitratireductor sp.]|nr:RNA-binding S4 domain-containing protein [Nitratireductor sp.]
MRIDKWLWFARQVKSRSLAQKLVAGGHVRVNGERQRSPSALVGPGDVLTLVLHSGSGHAAVRVLEIAACGMRRGPYREAVALYVDRSPEPPADREAAPAAPIVQPGSKPDRRERHLARKLAGKDGI